MDPELYGLIGIFLTLSFWFYLSKRVSLKKRSEKLNSSVPTWKSLESLRSPPSIPFLGHIYHLMLPGLNLLQLLLDWNTKYGPIYKMSVPFKNLVMVNDPSAIQKILMSPSRRHLNKDDLYQIALDGVVRQGLFALNYDNWHLHRKVLKRAFTYKSLCHQLKLINEHAKQLVIELAEEKDTNIDAILHHRTLKLVLHTIMEMDTISDEQLKRFCHDFNESENVSYDKMGAVWIYITVILNKALVSRGKAITASRILHPWQIIPPIWYFHPNNTKLKVHVRSVHRLLEVAIAKYRSAEQSTPLIGKVDEKDVQMGIRPLESMMELMVREGMSDEEIQSETLSMLFAGHETTSWSIIYLLLRLAFNSDIQARCHREVAEIFASKLDDELTMDDLSKLKYLERCIMEGLRMHPVLPAMMRKIEDPIQISDDLILPADISVIISPYAVHYDPKVYPNPEIFDPDRFAPENIKARNPCAFIAFSAGPRNCIGEKTAIMSLKVIVAHILRKYLVGTKLRSWNEVQLEFQLSLIMTNSPGLTFTERKV